MLTWVKVLRIVWKIIGCARVKVFLLTKLSLWCVAKLQMMFAQSCVLIVTCNSLSLQAVPKKKKDSARKSLAKILAHILLDCRNAKGLSRKWWEVFNVSFACSLPC